MSFDHQVDLSFARKSRTKLTFSDLKVVVNRLLKELINKKTTNQCSAFSLIVIILIVIIIVITSAKEIITLFLVAFFVYLFVCSMVIWLAG